MSTLALYAAVFFAVAAAGAYLSERLDAREERAERRRARIRLRRRTWNEIHKLAAGDGTDGIAPGAPAAGTDDWRKPW